MRCAVLLVLTVLLAPRTYAQTYQTRLSLQELCREAREELDKGEYPQARETAKRAITLDIRSGEAQCVLGQSEFALGNLPGAEKHLGEALEIDPGLLVAHRVLGATFLRQRRFKPAEVEFKTVLTSHPDDSNCLYGLGLSLLSQGKPSQALDPLIKAHGLNPSDADVMAGILEAHMKLGQANEATAILEELNQKFRNDYTEQMQLAELLVHEGAYQLATVQFKHLLKAKPDSYELNYDLALAYHRAGKEDQAAAQLRTMLAQKNDAELQNLLGGVEEKRGRYPEALIAYRQAAKLEPGNEEFQLDYATELAQHWNPAEALKAFAAGVKTFPNSGRMWMAMGGCYYLVGKYDEAAKALLQASRLVPESPGVYALLGLAYDAAGPLQKTIEEKFRVYIGTHPDDATARYFFGKILLAQSQGNARGTLDEAQKELGKAIELNPALVQARIELATLLRRQGDFRAAQTELEAAVKIDPASSEADYQLMYVYRKLGQPQKATAALQKFSRFKNQPDQNASRKEVMRLLGGTRR